MAKVPVVFVKEADPEAVATTKDPDAPVEVIENNETVDLEKKI